MRRVISILFLLLAVVVLAHSKSFVELGGRDGTSLLRDLTNGSINSTGVNDTNLNLSHDGTTVLLSGDNSTALMDSLRSANNTTDLSTWGSQPRTPPPPPTYDPKAAQTYQVLRDNHIVG
jgi:hypothetical protein